MGLPVSGKREEGKGPHVSGSAGFFCGVGKRFGRGGGLDGLELGLFDWAALFHFFLY